MYCLLFCLSFSFFLLPMFLCFLRVCVCQTDKTHGREMCVLCLTLQIFIHIFHFFVDLVFTKQTMTHN